MMCMNLVMEMELCHELRMELTGGNTQTIFPKVEEWLQQDGDRWRCLEYVGSRASMESYRSVVDYLHAQVIPGARWDCTRFYAGKGPPLREVIVDSQRRVDEALLLIALEVAHQAWCAKRRASWRQVRAVVEQLAA